MGRNSKKSKKAAVKPPKSKKIAVIVDNLYIPEEIEAYQKHFQNLGMTVELLTRCWGQPKRVYFGDVISDLEPVADVERQKKDFPLATFNANGIATDSKLSSLEVTKDFKDVRVEDYAAVLMAANYCSVRLRFSEDGEPRNAPAVVFFAEAMKNKKIIKGALCHGLWLLTPRPKLLKGRKVICHPVVAADIRNAGAIIKPNAAGVVVDKDLVTGLSKHEATGIKPPATLPPYIQAIIDRIRSVK
jgi:protease I